MAQNCTLKDKNTGDTIYPLTSAKQVRMSDGSTLDENTARWAKTALFDDMWRELVGKNGTVDHTHVEADGVERHYYLNELWLTYEEAMAIMAAGQLTNQDILLRYYGAKIRTHLPTLMRLSVVNAERTFAESLVEVVDLPLLVPSTSAFSGCKKLKVVKYIYSPNNQSEIKNQGIWSGCESLEEIGYVSRVWPTSFSLSGSPRINQKSLKTIIRAYNDNAPIVITVHPDVYAKLTDEANTEWHAVLTAAAEKNITFATV